jgi:hypothetical protein
MGAGAALRDPANVQGSRSEPPDPT